jgi:hypothetical protein
MMNLIIQRDLTRRLRIRVLLVGWLLLYSRWGGEWRPLDEFSSYSYCNHTRTARVHEESLQEIGGALAGQSGDNPMRQRALARAERRVRARYRCEPDRGRRGGRRSSTTADPRA